MIRQAIILAGGEGRRFRPYTSDRPKAMVHVKGRPIAEHQLAWLRRHGVTEIVFSLGYRADVVQSYFGESWNSSCRISYAVETEPLGRGGGLRLAMEYLPFPDEQCFAVNGDIITDCPLDEFFDHHARLSVAATIGVVPYRSSWGVVAVEDGLVREFNQSPVLPYWINAGIYVLTPEVKELLPTRGDHEDSTFPELAREARLGAFEFRHMWLPIDTEKDLLLADRQIEAAVDQ